MKIKIKIKKNENKRKLTFDMIMEDGHTIWVGQVVTYIL